MYTVYTETIICPKKPCCYILWYEALLFCCSAYDIYECLCVGCQVLESGVMTTSIFIYWGIAGVLVCFDIWFFLLSVYSDRQITWRMYSCDTVKYQYSLYQTLSEQQNERTPGHQGDRAHLHTQYIIMRSFIDRNIETTLSLPLLSRRRRRYLCPNELDNIIYGFNS